MSEIISFQNGVQPDAGYAGCIDTVLYKFAVNNNSGQGTVLTLQPATWNGLIRFDISSIPTNAKVEDAELFIKSYDQSAAGKIVEIYNGLVEWIEGTKAYAVCDIGEPCWNWREYNTVAWGAVGGLAGTDYEAGSEDSMDVAADTTWYSIHIPIMAQLWVNDPANNFGAWLLRTDAGTYNRMCSAQFATAASHPILTVTYSLSSKKRSVYLDC